MDDGDVPDGCATAALAWILLLVLLAIMLLVALGSGALWCGHPC